MGVQVPPRALFLFPQVSDLRFNLSGTQELRKNANFPKACMIAEGYRYAK